MHRLILLLCLVLLSACSAHGKKSSGFSLPGSPERIEIIDWKKVPPDQFTVAAAADVRDATGTGLQQLAYTPPDGRLRAGDVIDVTGFDIGEDGLLQSDKSKELRFGRVTIDRNNTVSLPFADKISVRNLTPEGLEAKIRKSMKGYAINPQVVVTLVSSPASSMNVNGDVNTPGRYPIEAGRERLLDIVALAGGAKDLNGQVTLIRENRRVSVPLSVVMNDKKSNIVLQANDQLILGDSSTAKFASLGAFKNVGEFSFEPGKLSLRQAIERAGGFQDGYEQAADLYVFRSLDVPAVSAGAAPTRKPVAFHLDMRDVSAYLSMPHFGVRDGDTLFVIKEPVGG
jgi:polysaccharide export outer membrane protein